MINPWPLYDDSKAAIVRRRRYLKPTRVINERYTKPGPDAVDIGSGSIWSNPFSFAVERGPEGLNDDLALSESLRSYSEWLHEQTHLLARIGELRGKTLVCTCRPPEGFRGRLLCHGQILAGLADGVPPERIP